MPDNKDTEKNIPAGVPTAQKQKKHVDGTPDSMKTEE